MLMLLGGRVLRVHAPRRSQSLEVTLLGRHTPGRSHAQTSCFWKVLLLGGHMFRGHAPVRSHAGRSQSWGVMLPGDHTECRVWNSGLEGARREVRTQHRSSTVASWVPCTWRLPQWVYSTQRCLSSGPSWGLATAAADPCHSPGGMVVH